MPNIANSVASPATLNKIKDENSDLRQSKGTVEFTPTADGDTLLLCRLPVRATLDSIRIAADDLASTSGTVNLGFYQTDADITIIDEDAIATAIDVGGGATAMTEYRYEVKDINTINDRVWELAGLSAEPDYGEVYLALTVAAVSGAQAGTVSFYCDYSV
jgi:hypothetical protein